MTDQRNLFGCVFIIASILNVAPAVSQGAESFCERCEKAGGHCHGDNPKQCLNTFRNRILTVTTPDGQVSVSSTAPVSPEELKKVLSDIEKTTNTLVGR